MLGNSTNFHSRSSRSGDPSRRRLLQWLGAATASLTCRKVGAVNTAYHAPILGAIRWDAWYDPDGSIGRAVEESLGPADFHSRMPFFGREIDQTHVRIDGYNQVTFDQEIVYARDMGLDYWAFCWYEDGSPLRRAWTMHQRSARRDEVKWCMLWLLSHLGGPDRFFETLPDYVLWMSQTNYQRVNDAPLVYLYLDSDTVLAKVWGGVRAIATALDGLRSACRAAKLQAPHFVIMNSNPSNAATIMKQINGSAISNYMGWIPADHPAPFSKLLDVNRIFWDKMAATGVPLVPIVMTGWDIRPRLLHAPPWETAERLKSTHGNYVTPGTNQQIDSAIQAAEQYIKDHPRECPSNLLLIYSWDECDEGGGALISKHYLASQHHLR